MSSVSARNSGFRHPGPPNIGVRVARTAISHPSRAYQQSACRNLLDQILKAPAFCPGPVYERFAWSLTRKESGAPQLLLEGAPSGLSISMAHSGRWIAVAVASCARVGVDIERVGRRKNFSAMAEYMGWQEQVNGEEDFMSMWTMWEACVKLEESSIFCTSNSAFESLGGIEPGEAWLEKGPWGGLKKRTPDGAHFALAVFKQSQATATLEFAGL